MSSANQSMSVGFDQRSPPKSEVQNDSDRDEITT
jgi:hypothetical protein